MSLPQLDLVVIGGGVHGCAVARDAALRGLKVALFERGDLGCGTSSASSKLIHGGLRYLEDFRLRLVREGLRERGHLLETAPHLARPLPFLLPVYDDGRWSRWMLRVGLTTYDLLSGRNSLGRHRWVPREECLRLEPGLRADGLQGAFTFTDAQVDDARLCVENALDAAHHGAQICPRHEVIGLLQENGVICGVRLRGDDGVREIRANTVVNCAGPWVARVSDGQQLASRVELRWSRGTHIVLSRRTHGHALLMSAPQDGRVVFALPYKGRTLLGTTEVETRSAIDTIDPTGEEMDYLLECSRHYFPEEVAGRENILFSFAGLRTLPGSSSDSDLGRISREALIQEDAPGLLTLVGGKLTTHRATAEEIVGRLGARLDRPLPPCSTRHRNLPGAGGPEMNEYFEVAEDLLFKKYPQSDLAVLRHLLGTYGQRHLEILRHFDRDVESAQRIEERYPFTQAEVNYLVEEEWAQSVEDLVRRRTYRIFLGHFDEGARARWEGALHLAVQRMKEKS
jgi:glycerol-3-phosphate dehydrogenase